MTDEVVEMKRKNKDEFIESSGRTNVECWHAPLKLYSYLEKLEQRVLYADTDFIIFITKGNEWKPSLGDYLGYLTDEA